MSCEMLEPGILSEGMEERLTPLVRSSFWTYALKFNFNIKTKKKKKKRKEEEEEGEEEEEEELWSTSKPLKCWSLA